MTLPIPSGMSWHPHLGMVTDMRTVEALLDGYGPGHALQAGEASDIAIGLGFILARARYYFRSQGTSTLGRWERERPMGGLYVLQVNGGEMDPAGRGWSMWLEGAGAPVASARPTPPEPMPPSAVAPPPVRRSGGPSWLWLALVVGLAFARKGS